MEVLLWKRYTEEQIIKVLKGHEAGAKVDFAASLTYLLTRSTTGATNTQAWKWIRQNGSSS